MTPGKYEELAMRSQADQLEIAGRLQSLHVRQLEQLTQLRNGVTGLSDEVGELNSCVKKYVEYGQPLDITNIQEEVGDCLWRLVQICQAIGYTLEQAMIHNIQKLKVRYPEGFSDFQAAEENRDRAAERQLLEEPLNYTTPETKLSKCSYCGSVGTEPCKCSGVSQTGQGWAEPPEQMENKNFRVTSQDDLHDLAVEECSISLERPRPDIHLILDEAEGDLSVSFGDGLVRDKPLNHSYSRYCKQCNKTPVHEHNVTGICPDCAADLRAGRVMNVQEELNRKVEELPIDPPVDGGYSGQTC